MDGNKEKEYNTPDTKQENRQENSRGELPLKNFENFNKKFNQCRNDLGNLNSYLINIKEDLTQTISDASWLKEELINTQKDNSFKQKEITSLKKELEKSQNEQNEYREQIKDLKSEIQNYVSKLQAKDKQIEDCKTEIAKNEEYVNRIKNKIKSLTQVTGITEKEDNTEIEVEVREPKNDNKKSSNSLKLKHITIEKELPTKPIVVIKPDGNYKNYESKYGISKFFKRHVAKSPNRRKFKNLQSAKQVRFLEFIPNKKALNNVSDFPMKKANNS